MASSSNPNKSEIKSDVDSISNQGNLWVLNNFNYFS